MPTSGSPGRPKPAACDSNLDFIRGPNLARLYTRLQAEARGIIPAVPICAMSAVPADFHEFSESQESRALFSSQFSPIWPTYWNSAPKFLWTGPPILGQIKKVRGGTIWEKGDETDCVALRASPSFRVERPGAGGSGKFPAGIILRPRHGSRHIGGECSPPCRPCPRRDQCFFSGRPGGTRSDHFWRPLKR